MQTKLKLKSKRNYDIVMLILYSFEDIDLEELLWQTDEFSPTVYAPLITTTILWNQQCQYFKQLLRNRWKIIPTLDPRFRMEAF